MPWSIDAAQLTDLELLRIGATHENPDVAADVANAVPRALARFIKRTGSSRDTITVVERASAPSTPISPNMKQNLVLAFVLGLILAAGLALLREGLSDRIEGVEELERIAGHPVIAVIPNLKFQQIVSPPRARGGERRLGSVPTATGKVKKIEIAKTESSEAASRWSARG